MISTPGGHLNLLQRIQGLFDFFFGLPILNAWVIVAEFKMIEFRMILLL